jgi:AraC-like DNA-binding protein
MAKISSVTFHFVLKSLEKNSSISIDEMLKFADLSQDVLSRHDSQIDSEKLSEIFKFCMEKSGDYTLALKIGSSITYHSLGVLGYLMLNANNLKEVIEKFDYYQKLISGFMKFYLTKNEKYYKLAIYINENPMIPVPSYHAEVHLSAILTILNQIIGKDIIPDLTYFTIDSMSNIDEYKKIFGENIILHKSENAIFFETDKLNITVNDSNPVMLEYFESQANKILEDMKITSWYAKVKREILKNIGDNEITIDFIASKFDISTRTLQYHLKDENIKFRDALLSVRMQLANHYIKNTKMDFSSIAFFLGYSEASSFFRAYKKYYKNTPKKYLM